MRKRSKITLECLFSFKHPSNVRTHKQRECGSFLISGRLPFPRVQGQVEANLNLRDKVQADLGDTAGVVPDRRIQQVQTKRATGAAGIPECRDVYTVL